MQKNHNLSPRQNAFTLLEALIVFTVIAVLAGFSLPAFRNMLHKSQINAAVNEFYAAFFLAQKEAIRRKHQVLICPSTDGKTCLAGYSNGSKMDLSAGYIVLDSNSNTVIQDFPPTSTVKLTINKGRGVKLQFINNGRMVANMNGANLTAELGLQTVQLNISSSGRIQRKWR